MFKQSFLLFCFWLFFTIGFEQNSNFSSGLIASKIPFEMSQDGHIFLRVRVNGSEPLLFGLDSGFEQTAIGTKQAKTLNLKLYVDTQVVGGGEKREDFSFSKDISFGQ